MLVTEWCSLELSFFALSTADHNNDRRLRQNMPFESRPKQETNKKLFASNKFNLDYLHISHIVGISFNFRKHVSYFVKVHPGMNQIYGSHAQQ